MRSSGGILGAVKLEKDLAADLRAWRLAVRFDLRVERGLGGGCLSGKELGSGRILSRGSSDTTAGDSRGWSMHSSTGGEMASFSLRSQPARRFSDGGVDGLLKEHTERSSFAKEGTEGIESLETDLDDMQSRSPSVSTSKALSLSDSSGFSSRTSSGARLGLNGIGPSSRLHS